MAPVSIIPITVFHYRRRFFLISIDSLAFAFRFSCDGHLFYNMERQAIITRC